MQSNEYRKEIMGLCPLKKIITYDSTVAAGPHR